MKIKNKFLMGALLTVSSLGVVGSITGTYAWFSYNTKSPISYHGVTTGDTENLQIKTATDTEWKQTLSSDEFLASSTDDGYAGNDLKPVTFATNQLYNADLEDFVGMPSAGNPEYSDAGLTDDDDAYVWLRSEIQLQCINQTTDEYYAQNIYLSDLTFVCSDDDYDVSDALRMHIKCGTTSLLIAPGIVDEDNEIGSLDLYGTLDLDGDGNDDQAVYSDSEYLRPAYDFDTSETGLQDVVYGVDGVVEQYYTRDAVIATFEDGKRTEGGVLIGTTNDSDDPLEIVITIYLQGWAPSIKDDNINAEFDFGMTFQCDVL